MVVREVPAILILQQLLHGLGKLFLWDAMIAFLQHFFELGTLGAAAFCGRVRSVSLPRM
jgi:hypothetical protein